MDYIVEWTLHGPEWEFDARFDTKEEALAHAASEAADSKCATHRVVVHVPKVVATFEPTGEL